MKLGQGLACMKDMLARIYEEANIHQHHRRNFESVS